MQLLHKSLACSLCGQALFVVRDTRFGSAPPSVLCRACTLPAFRPASNVGAARRPRTG